jgi:hypothetical protein
MNHRMFFLLLSSCPLLYASYPKTPQTLSTPEHILQRAIRKFRAVPPKHSNKPDNTIICEQPEPDEQEYVFVESDIPLPQQTPKKSK